MFSFFPYTKPNCFPHPTFSTTAQHPLVSRRSPKAVRNAWARSRFSETYNGVENQCRNYTPTENVTRNYDMIRITFQASATHQQQLIPQLTVCSRINKAHDAAVFPLPLPLHFITAPLTVTQSQRSLSTCFYISKSSLMKVIFMR